MWTGTDQNKTGRLCVIFPFGETEIWYCRLAGQRASAESGMRRRTGEARIQHDAAHRIMQKGAENWQKKQLKGRAELPPMELCREPAGKPYLTGEGAPQISISHTDGLAACAFCGAKVGLDAEKIRRFPEAVARKVLSGREYSLLAASANPDLLFFRYWTLKEAYGKAAGCGIGYEMRSLDFLLRDTADYVLTEGCFDIRAEFAGKKFADYCFYQRKQDGCILSLCVKSEKACI